MSIPKLELQAALLGSRLAETIKKNHNININKTFFWTDSKAVICCIRSDARNFKPFVAHRIVEILELTDSSEWSWLSTNENVADEATRENINCDWRETSRWLNGPSFLVM